MNWPDSAFWTYSLKIYARPDMRRRCLELQDEAGADVNILMLCLWLASLGKPALPAETLNRIDRAAAPWRDQVIRPLRQARRGLAAFAALPEGVALKVRLQDLELDAEHQAQLALEKYVKVLLAGEAAGFSPGEAAMISIGNYLKMISPGEVASLKETVERLVQSAV